MSQRINRFSIHSYQSRDDDSEGHNDQHQQVLNDADDKEVRPELRDPVLVELVVGDDFATEEETARS